MLTPADAGLYEAAVNTSHQAAFRVSVLDGNGDKIGEIDYSDGSVSATLGSQITRRADLLVDPARSPVTASDLLFPNGNRLYIERGISYGCADPDLLPLFHGRIEKVFDTPDGPTRITAVDLAGDIKDANFPVPTNSRPDYAIADEFRRLVVGALPSATFGPSDIFASRVGPRTWDTDRSQALDDLAASVGAFWWTLSDGRFVIRRVPWTIPRSPEMVITDDYTAALCAASEPLPDLPTLRATYSTRERSREQVFNIITVSSELTDGTPPLVYTAADTDPTSPTWIGGGFGIKSRPVRSDVALTLAQVRTMAETTLRRSKAFLDSWSLQCVPDARVELGDCALIACQGIVSTQIIAALRMSLNATARMDIGTRALLPELDLGVAS